MAQPEGVLRVQEDGLLQFGSRGAATKLALDTFVSAFAGTDPTSLHFARPSPAAQRAFWQRYICGHILDSEPRLNFLSKGGEAAIVANLLPQQERGWLASMWQGVQLLLAAAALSKWAELAAYDDYLAAKRRQFLQAHGSFVHIVSIGARPEAQGKGVGSRLLARVLRYADEHGLPSYLEASSERSRRLYLRHGFCDIETWHGGFPVFLMWRPAGGSAAAAHASAAEAASSAAAADKTNSGPAQHPAIGSSGTARTDGTSAAAGGSAAAGMAGNSALAEEITGGTSNADAGAGIPGSAANGGGRDR